ncbi:hypothetical protein Tco_0841103 [Tanacetum coccineum]|uniref:Uncharacterized protein n=1 Tax=Tanacetum coccineum TaxID=301880 RepID=A0ABQ5AWH7_9ASTR
MSVFEVRSSDETHTSKLISSPKQTVSLSPLPITRNILTLRDDINHLQGNTNEVNVEKPNSVNESVVSTPNINKDKVIIEDWNSDDENDVSEVSPVKTNENSNS